MDFVGRDGVADMHELVSKLVTNVKIPLMLDSTEWEKMEAGLKLAGGKCILNSTNYEDGEPRFLRLLEFAKEYGAAIVIGLIDEDGMARTAEDKVKIARRAFKQATEFGIEAHDIFFDPLGFTDFDRHRRRPRQRARNNRSNQTNSRRNARSEYNFGRFKCFVWTKSGIAHRFEFNIFARMRRSRNEFGNRQCFENFAVKSFQRTRNRSRARIDLRQTKI